MTNLPLVGKILLGGSTVVIGAGGTYLLVRSKKSVDNVQTEVPEFLSKICTSSSCSLNKSKLQSLGFIFGEESKETVHVNNSTAEQIATLSWQKIEGNVENFPLGLIFKFSTSLEKIEILKGQNDTNNKIEIASGKETSFKLNQKNEKYYFKKIEQSDKESSAGIDCSNGSSCAGSNVEGLDSGASITRTATTSTKEYPDGFKYRVSYTQKNDKDGYYKITFENKKWKLFKVEDLMTKWDKSVLSQGTWTVEQINNEIKVKIESTDSSINGSPGTSWNWECLISANSIPSEKSLEINTQTQELKKQLGIDPTSTESTNQRRKFVENCARNRGDSEKQHAKQDSFTGSEITVKSKITLGTEDKTTNNQGGNQLQLKDFEKIFSGEIESVSAT